MTNDKLFNILEYLIDNLEYFGSDPYDGDKDMIKYCKTIRQEVFSNQPDGLTFDVIPKIPTED